MFLIYEKISFNICVTHANFHPFIFSMHTYEWNYSSFGVHDFTRNRNRYKLNINVFINIDRQEHNYKENVLRIFNV